LAPTGLVGVTVLNVTTHSVPAAALSARLDRARAATAAAGLDALLVSPGPDLRYLTGYDAIPLERLTLLVLPVEGDPVLIAPFLEVAAALASPVGELGLTVRDWHETDNPYDLVGELVGTADEVAVDDHMWAVKALNIVDALPLTVVRAAGPVLGGLRAIKDAAEVEALVRAGAAIDSVHAQVAGLLRPGRTEREVGRDIAELILAAGHVSVDFVIVGSVPNGASPHHELSDRVLQANEPVVVDIGGTMPDGYCSDSTRTYAVGDVGDEYRGYYATLQAAQAAGVAAAQVGITCADVDSITRKVMVDGGIGEYFIHRTGHGIGLETHEDPYIVETNATPMEVGMAYSVEPGFYLSGRFGARIEDIVVLTDDGPKSVNHSPHELVVVDV
jgi:Xaa-Pro aminopeptidase